MLGLNLLGDVLGTVVIPELESLILYCSISALAKFMCVSSWFLRLNTSLCRSAF